MSLVGVASAEYYFTSRIPLGRGHRVHWPIPRKWLRWLSKKVFRFRICSPHLRSGQFHEPSRRNECWISFDTENSSGTWTQRVHWPIRKGWLRWLSKKVFRFRICSLQLGSRQSHEPSRSCECWILFHNEDSSGTWTQGSFTDTKKVTKVAFKKVFRFRIVSPHLGSSQSHEPSRSCECWIIFHIENSLGTRTQSPLTDTNKMTKVAFENGVSLPDRFASSRVEPIPWA